LIKNAQVRQGVKWTQLFDNDRRILSYKSVPFFMEETVQVLLDEGALTRNGTVKLTKALEELKIPPTVQAILASRIDRPATWYKE
jgi:hypothetical protein